MNMKGQLSSSSFQNNNAASSPLTLPRSTTSNRPSHAPPATASVNQGVAISAKPTHPSITNVESHRYVYRYVFFIHSHSPLPGLRDSFIPANPLPGLRDSFIPAIPLQRDCRNEGVSPPVPSLFYFCLSARPIIAVSCLQR